MSRLAWKRRVAALAACTVVLSSLASAAPAFAQGGDATAQLAAGDKAAKDKNWKAALEAYEASNRSAASAAALEGAANAYFNLKDDASSYTAYADWMKLYGEKVPKPKKAAVEARMKELATRTGDLELVVNEAGAAITIDDKPVGTTPTTAPIRLSAGPHHVRITKRGFLPYDQAPNVSAGQSTKIDVKLEAQSGKGRLVVKEKSGKPIRVLVDGVDVGDAPWSGEVAAGQHDVAGRSPSLAAAPEKVTIEGGKTKEVELSASATTAPFKIATNDGKGFIYIDGRLVGEGQYSADVPAGPHKIRITRDGYDPVEEDILLKDKEPFSRTITMQLVSKIETGPIQKQERALEGIYGGFSLVGGVGIGGTDSSMQKLCDGSHPAELGSCATRGAVGAGITGFVGYHWDPVGVEFYLGGHYDQQNVTLDWNASTTDPGLGPDPARTEEFKIRRAGGHGALRVRYTIQGEKIRFSIAAGVGLANRIMFLARDTTAKANSADADKFVTDSGLSYWSPILSFGPSVQYRLTSAVAVALGLHLLFENPTTFKDKPPTTEREGFRRLGSGPTSVGLSTPAYEVASGTQVYFGPFIGMMFGP